MVRLWCIDEARQYTCTSRQLNASHFCNVVDFYHDSDIFLYSQFDGVLNLVEIHVANQKDGRPHQQRQELWGAPWQLH